MKNTKDLEEAILSFKKEIGREDKSDLFCDALLASTKNKNLALYLWLFFLKHKNKYKRMLKRKEKTNENRK